MSPGDGSAERGTDDRDAGSGDARENDGQRFDRLPATESERVVEGRATREAVLDWWSERFGIPPSTFEGHSFWEKGAGKVWALADDAVGSDAADAEDAPDAPAAQTVADAPDAASSEAATGSPAAGPTPVADPIEVEALGLKLLRTRQEHWKPTTNAVQRFGDAATRNAIELAPGEARRFAAGEDQSIERWDGDWGYLIATHELAGGPAVLGVGLYVHGELRSRIPKGRRRELSGSLE